MPTIITRGAASARGFGFGGRILAQGSTSYTTAGTFTFVAPANVFSVGVTAFGGGGNGSVGTGSKTYGGMCGCVLISQSLTGGGGGGSGGKGIKSVPVTPGNSYTVVVGGSAQTSYFINSSTVSGNNGSNGSQPSGGAGGTFVGTSGTNGNSGSSGASSSTIGPITVNGGTGGAALQSSYGTGGNGGNAGYNCASVFSTSGQTNGNSGAVLLVYNG